MSPSPGGWLEHPLSRGIDRDDPALTAVRRRILAEKPFLRRVLADWYRKIAQRLGRTSGPVLELGSGAGFLATEIPGLLRSEVTFQPGVDLIADGGRLPFLSGALSGMTLIDVLHHLPDPRRFFGEATRCLASGGNLVMIEPWGGWWASLVYRFLHHETFDPCLPAWKGNQGGPLSDGNNALAWMLFHRDRERFPTEVPGLDVVECRPFQPLLYLASGGLGSWLSFPAWTFRPLSLLERLLEPWREALGMFVLLHLRRCPE